MAGSMLTYSNLIRTNEGTETHAVKMVARKQREKLLGCLMLPLAFLYFILFSASIMLHEDISDVYMIESELRNQMDDLFSEIEDIDTLWDTLMGPFSEILFPQMDGWKWFQMTRMIQNDGKCLLERLFKSMQRLKRAGRTCTTDRFSDPT